MTQTPEPVVDPLADLRDDGTGQTEILEPVPYTQTVTQTEWDQARDQLIAGWHADTVALGFLHKGGRCGCHYLAGVALHSALALESTPEDV